jgi:hypothetical protein
MENILIKDLCRRLPYGVRCKCGLSDAIYILKGINPDREGASFAQLTSITGISIDLKCSKQFKPYLFPLSSMTEEQKIECFKGTDIELDEFNEIWSRFPFSDTDIPVTNLSNWLKVLDWLDSHYFDYRGLIKNGLALDATNLLIYF